MPHSLLPFRLRVLPVAGAVLSLGCCVPSLGQAVSATTGEAQAFNARPGGPLSAGTSAGVLPLFPQDRGAPADGVIVPSGNGSLQVLPSGAGSSSHAKGRSSAALGATEASAAGSGMCFQPGVGWINPSNASAAGAPSFANVDATQSGQAGPRAGPAAVTPTMVGGGSLSSAGATLRAGGASVPQSGALDGLCPQPNVTAAMGSEQTASNSATTGLSPAINYAGGAPNRSPWMPKAGAAEPTSPDTVMHYVSSHPLLSLSEAEYLREQLGSFHARTQFDEFIAARDAKPQKKTCKNSRDSEEQTGLFADEKEHGDDESCSSSQKSHGDGDTDKETDSDKEKSDGWLGPSSF